MNISRRTFLGGLGAAGLFGSPAAAIAAPRILKVSPIRGGGADSVLNFTRLEIPVGATAPFSALHVSDTHLNFWDVTDFYGSERWNDHFEKRWVRFPQALNSFYATLDRAAEARMPILHTGDLIDWNTSANIRTLRRNLRGVDFHYAMGNHEYHTSDGKLPALAPAAARDRLQSVISNDLTVASRILNGVNFVAYDNGEKNLRAETIRRVRAEFDKGLPVVLMCHIPPAYTPRFLENSLASKRMILRGQGVPEADLPTRIGEPVQSGYDERTGAFYAWLREQRQLKAVLCGHTHVEERDRFSDSALMYVAGGNYEGCGYEITFV